MLVVADPDHGPIQSPVRDTVEGLSGRTDGAPPAIVSISDIHGYVEPARSALLAVGECADLPPIVSLDEDGLLHWADDNYVLVFNGDLIDRGPANEEVLQLVKRLAAEAPRGRVRVVLGNHEAMVLSPDALGFARWFSGQIRAERRQAFLNEILAGGVVAAYRGYRLTYAHAGLPSSYASTEVNEDLIAATGELQHASGTPDDPAVQREIMDEYHRVLGVGSNHLKGKEAGIVWLDFEHLPSDSPPQIVGHTRHSTPRRKGNVFCQNVIRNNLDSPGGEAVFVETPQTLSAVIRNEDGSVSREWLLEADETIC